MTAHDNCQKFASALKSTNNAPHYLVKIILVNNLIIVHLDFIMTVYLFKSEYLFLNVVSSV